MNVLHFISVCVVLLLLYQCYVYLKKKSMDKILRFTNAFIIIIIKSSGAQKRTWH